MRKRVLPNGDVTIWDDDAQRWVPTPPSRARKERTPIAFRVYDQRTGETLIIDPRDVTIVYPGE